MASRNAQGGGTIRHRSDGRWEARYTVGRDPGTGKQIRKSVYGKTQQEVRKKLASVISDLDDGTYKEPTKMTVKQWFEIWLSEYTINLKPLTLKAYKSNTNNHIIPKLGKTDISKITPHQIQKMINELSKDHTPKTVKNIHGIIHQGFAQAVALGYIPVNPADNCKLPKITKPEIKPLDKTEIPTFLEAIKGDPYERLFIVDLFTGLRQSELIGLTWDYINFEDKTIHVYRQWQRISEKSVKSRYEFVSLKSNKPRLIKPASFIMDLLRAEKIKQAENQLKAGTAWDNEHNFVFTDETGKPANHITLLSHLKKSAEKINRPDLRFHDLRHSYAVISLQIGDDIKTVQENLGHYSSAFTLDTYAHVTDSMRKESAERMNNFIKTL